MQVRDEQFNTLSSAARQEFLLTAVCDWFAIYEQVHGAKPTTSFDTAWNLADDIAHELDEVDWHDTEDRTYDILHQALSACERGISEECIYRAVQLFCDAMPADEAGFALFTMKLERGQN